MPRLCLYSLTRQTVKPNEIIIADDGSTAETKKTIAKFRDLLPVKYVWQEDKGFRKSMIMNKAFAICESEYVIQLEGDICSRQNLVSNKRRQGKQGVDFKRKDIWIFRPAKAGR